MSDSAPSQPGLTKLDRDILNIIQQGFPIHHSPYAELARLIGGTSEQQVFDRVRSLLERKIIRRLGAVFDTARLGFASTLLAMRVPPDRVDEVGSLVSQYPGVSHNYRRDHEFNLWFTLAAPSRDALMNTIDEIRERTGGLELLDLPATRIHKIAVNFSLAAGTEAEAT